MPNGFAYDVFLSHSEKDKAVVRPLAERLRADGRHPKAEGRMPKADIGFQPLALSLQPLLRAFGSDWAQLACRAGVPERRLKGGTFRFREDRRPPDHCPACAGAVESL